MDHVCHCADQRLMYPVISLSHLCSLRGLRKSLKASALAGSRAWCGLALQLGFCAGTFV